MKTSGINSSQWREKQSKKILSNPSNQSSIKEAPGTEHMPVEVVTNHSTGSANSLYYDEIGSMTESIRLSKVFMDKVRIAFKLDRFVNEHKGDLSESQVGYAIKYINSYKKYFKEVEYTMLVDEAIDKFIKLHDEVSTLLGRAQFNDAYERIDDYVTLRERVIELKRDSKNSFTAEQWKKVAKLLMNDNPTYNDLMSMKKSALNGEVENFDNFTIQSMAEMRQRNKEAEEEVFMNTLMSITRMIDQFKEMVEEEGNGNTFEIEEVIKQFKHATIQMYCDFCPFNSGKTCTQSPKDCLTKEQAQKLFGFMDVFTLTLGNFLREHNAKVGKKPENPVQPEEIESEEKSEDESEPTTECIHGPNWGKEGSMLDEYKDVDEEEKTPIPELETTVEDLPF